MSNDIVIYDVIKEYLGDEKKLPSSLDSDLQDFSDDMEKAKTDEAKREIVESFQQKRLRQRLWDTTGHGTALVYDKALKELMK